MTLGIHPHFNLKRSAIKLSSICAKEDNTIRDWNLSQTISLKTTVNQSAASVLPSLLNNNQGGGESHEHAGASRGERGIPFP